MAIKLILPRSQVCVAVEHEKLIMMAFHCIAFNVQKYVVLCPNDPQRQQGEMEDIY